MLRPRHILETSAVDYVLFEAAGLIKDGLVREWRSVSKEEVAAMRAYLLAYVINRPTLSGYVRERLVQVRDGDLAAFREVFHEFLSLQVMAIIIKRQSVDDGGEDRAKVLSEVQGMITAAGATMQMQMVGCSVLSAIMQVGVGYLYLAVNFDRKATRIPHFLMKVVKNENKMK